MNKLKQEIRTQTVEILKWITDVSPITDNGNNEHMVHMIYTVNRADGLSQKHRQQNLYISYDLIVISEKINVSIILKN